MMTSGPMTKLAGVVVEHEVVTTDVEDTGAGWLLAILTSELAAIRVFVSVLSSMSGSVSFLVLRNVWFMLSGSLPALMAR